ncbi:MAG: CatB-related O-acetyltransferase [Hyphomicrobiaceae bacterium]
MWIEHVLSRLTNPDHLTRVALAGLIAKGRASIGDHSYGTPKVRFASAARLGIGRFCSFADRVEIFLGGNHRLDFVSTYPFHAHPKRWQRGTPLASVAATKGDVVIGCDVWIGSGARIMSGVSIGHGAVVGAGAVVGRDVPPFAIVAGNPAAVVRMRFSEAQIAGLLETAWWDLRDDQIAELAPLLSSTDIDGLIDRARRLRAANGGEVRT